MAFKEKSADEINSMYGGVDCGKKTENGIKNEERKYMESC